MKAIEKFINDFGIGIKSVLVVLGLGLAFFIFTLFDFESNKVYEYMVGSAPLWLPFITFTLAFYEWKYYTQKDYDLRQGRVTLEIKLPQEIFKSPEAMEMVLVQMYQTATPDNHVQTYWDGKHPPKFGLELVSRGGDVRFYISTPVIKFKNIIETQMYSQYPGIEVTELDIDYAAEIPWDPDKYDYFSLHYGLKKADAYPIKTYIEYGLHTMPKEEEKTDPITSVLELLGSVPPDNYMWIQILIDAHKEGKFKEGSLGFEPDWKEEARNEIKKIIDNAVERSGAESKGNVMQLLTDTERDTIKAIERSLGKLAFNTAIRGFYITKKGLFNPDYITIMNTGWRAFDDLNRNAIGVRWRTDFDWNWWQDPKGKQRAAWKKQELDEYKRRAYMPHEPGVDGPKVMTTEELATIFHLPGRVATTPSLARIPSKRAEPPANLPVG